MSLYEVVTKRAGDSGDTAVLEWCSAWIKGAMQRALDLANSIAVDGVATGGADALVYGDDLRSTDELELHSTSTFRARRRARVRHL